MTSVEGDMVSTFKEVKPIYDKLSTALSEMSTKHWETITEAIKVPDSKSQAFAQDAVAVRQGLLKGFAQINSYEDVKKTLTAARQEDNTIFN